MGLIGQVLEHVRWTPDPWAAVANEYTAQPHHARHEPPTSLPPALSATMNAVHAGALAPHPDTDLFLSGSHSDHVFMWRYGESHCRAAYVPITTPNNAPGGTVSGAPGAGGGTKRQALLLELLQSPHWDGAARLRYTRVGSRFVGVGEGGVVACWRQDLAPGPGGVGYADWAHHCMAKRGTDVVVVGDSGSQLIVSGRGERGGALSWWDTLAPGASACVGEVATLSVASMSASGAAGRQGGGKSVEPAALALMHGVGPGNSLLVYGDDAGDLVALDLRMLGPRPMPVWSVSRAHAGGVQCMATWGCCEGLAGTALPRPLPKSGAAARGSVGPNASASAPASRSGSVHGPGQVVPPYGSPAPGTPAAAAAAHGLQRVSPSGASQGTLSVGSLLVSGGKDGSVVVVDAADGSVVAAMERVHWQVRKNPLALFTGGGDRRAASGGGGAPSNAVGVAVTSLQCCEGGMLSTGADGVLRYHPFAALSSDEW